MARPKKPPRLYLRRRPGRSAQYVILDGSTEIGTGAGPNELERAARALETYLADRHQPPSGASQPEDLLVDEVMACYLREHAPNSPSRAWIADMSAPIITWWSGKTLANVNAPACREYVRWRTSQRIKRIKAEVRLVTDQTARHELKCLRAAINHYHREHGPLKSVPVVTMPPRSPPKDSYWLTRQEVAQRLRAARKRKETRHLARIILIGVYSGTRPGAILKLGWLPSPTGGWFDLEAGVLHRRGFGAKRSRKRLRRWQRADLALGIAHAVHYRGSQVKKLRHSWHTIRAEAGQKRHDGPHILRHTSATWLMQWGVDLFEAAGYLGMSAETLLQEYGHHHPDFQTNAAQAMPKKPVNRTRTG